MAPRDGPGLRGQLWVAGQGDAPPGGAGPGPGAALRPAPALVATRAPARNIGVGDLLLAAHHAHAIPGTGQPCGSVAWGWKY